MFDKPSKGGLVVELVETFSVVLVFGDVVVNVVDVFAPCVVPGDVSVGQTRK